jgi:hypothetical protein
LSVFFSDLSFLGAASDALAGAEAVALSESALPAAFFGASVWANDDSTDMSTKMNEARMSFTLAP